jgi:hypothetical protein
MTFVSSRRHIVGSLVALVGIGVYVYVVSDHNWLLAMAALYAVGYFATPKPAVSNDTAAPDSPEAIATFLEKFAAEVETRVDPPVHQRVLSIVASINQALPILARGTMQVDGTSRAVRRIATGYLPAAFDAYLRIPRAQRRRRAADGQPTPQETLQQQLVLLDERMHDILLSVQRNDLQSLLDNGRFLRSRFAAPASS